MTTPRRWLWLAFCAVILIAGGRKAWENEQDRKRERAWRAQIERLQREGRVVFDRLGPLLSAAHQSDDARRLLQAELNDGLPFESQASDQFDKVTWRDPRYNIQLEMTFVGDRLTVHRRNWGTAQLQQLHPRPRRNSRLNRAEQVRAGIAQFGPWVWVVLFVVALLSPWRSKALAEAALAASIVCGMAWLASPYYALSLQGIFSNDSLFYAVFMIGSSLTLLACRGTKSADESVEQPVRFDLKALLGVTTLVALAVATRPYGVVVAGFLLIGGGYYLLVRRAICRGFLGLQR